MRTAQAAPWLALALSLGSAAAPCLAAPTPSAAQLSRDAATAFKRGEYAAALDLLRRARDQAPEPAQLFVMGRCHEQLGQLTEARAAYESYLKEQLAAEDRALAERRLADVTRLIALSQATLVVTRTPGNATVNINGVKTGATGAVRHELKPGRYTVRIDAPGYEPYEQAVELKGGTTRELTVALVPTAPAEVPPAATATQTATETIVEPPGEEPSRALEWSLVGVGAASLATAAALTALSLDAQSDAEGGGGRTQSEAADASERGNTLGAAAWATWALGAGLVTTGVVLLLLPGDEAPAAPSLAPMPGGAIMGFGGSF